MTELLWFGAAFLVVFTGIVFGCRLTNKKKKESVSNTAKVEFVGDDIKVEWKGHELTFTFIYIDGQLNYSGVQCNEKYSVSLRTNGKNKKYPWILWAKCGDDEISIKTDLKGKYEVI